MSFNFPHPDGEHVKVKKAVVIVDVEELAAKDPDLKRLFDIVNEAATEIESLVAIIDSNVKAVFAEGIAEKSMDKANFALGGLGLLGSLGQHIVNHVQDSMQAALPEMIQNGLVDFGNEGENAPPPVEESNIWNFGS